MIERNARDREREEREKFDRELLTHARDTARIAVGEYNLAVEQANRRLSVIAPLDMLAAASPLPTSAFGVAVAFQATHPPVWVNRRGWVGGGLWNAISQANSADLKYPDFLSHHLEDENPNAPLVQINTPSRQVWKSARLPAEGLPFDREQWEREKTHKYGDDWRHDTLDLPTGTVRRVVYKPNPGGFRWGGGPPRSEPRPGESRSGESGRGSPSPPPPTGPSFINYYHIARPTTELELDVAGIDRDARDQKAAERASTADTRHTVRLLLAAGSVLTFLGLLVGGWVLVGIGLRPLHKLTDAVAQVNENDLHLPVEAGELSRELVPIHDRLVQTLDQLREAFEREKQAVADISHELRTPVASLLATVDITLRKPRTAEQYKRAWKTAGC